MTYEQQDLQSSRQRRPLLPALAPWRGFPQCRLAAQQLRCRGQQPTTSTSGRSRGGPYFFVLHSSAHAGVAPCQSWLPSCFFFSASRVPTFAMNAFAAKLRALPSLVMPLSHLFPCLQAEILAPFPRTVPSAHRPSCCGCSLLQRSLFVVHSPAVQTPCLVRLPLPAPASLPQAPLWRSSRASLVEHQKQLL